MNEKFMKGNNTGLTEKNLDQLANFLNQELSGSMLAAEIPDGAHIFYGSYDDPILTQGNIKLATKVLLGMVLGYVGEAAMVMVYEYAQGKQVIIDLFGDIQKAETEKIIETLHQKNQQTVNNKIKARLLA